MEDPYTGKPVDRLETNVPNGGVCDTCGDETIDRCWLCGAPQCCYTCCKNDLKLRIGEHNARAPQYITKVILQ